MLRKRKTSPASRLEGAVQLARLLADAQYLSRALKVVRYVLERETDGSNTVDLQLLEIECLIDLGRMEEARTALARVAGSFAEPSQRSAIQLMESYAFIREGRGREAFTRAAEVIRSVESTSALAARARWI